MMALLLFSATLTLGQKTKNINFSAKETTLGKLPVFEQPQIEASSFKVFEMDIESLKTQMVGVSHREQPNSGFVAKLNLPHPDGTFHTYHARENSTMAPGLAEQFPLIKTYDANGDDGAFVKWDVTPHGFHAMIMIPGESTIFIDPVYQGNTDYYIVYHKKHFTTDKLMDCSFNSDNTNLSNKISPTSGIVKSFGTCELRTYRLALAATGEYTIFHGGSVAQALAAQVTTMNRVNGVYEKDMAITMTIIANNNLIIYTNGGSDPYTNGDAGSMIGENQTNVTTVIGSANYDIGHVFGTNSGGLAGFGVVCDDSQKASGVTGSAAPVGDPFDIDYVAHEMGHQFGASHTFNNSCGGNINSPTAMEPGSGSTIMAYAGICAPNVQNNSDDHFHGVSLQEIDLEILSAGHTCEALTALSNNPPAITMTNGNNNVPANTPFSLTATVVDPDGDPVTYNWEQMNNEITTQPPLATATGGPNFRSYSSSTSPTRYFPNLADLAAGTVSQWEVLSSVTRTMNFRVTVRDNAPGPGGCNDHTDVTVTIDGNSGPFIVTYPTATGIVWGGATSETVTWDVANTDQAPVSCSTVDILMSDDGGLTYSYTLVSGVANDGSQSITVPNIATTTARVMVINSEGTFFDVSDNNFEITLATFDFTQSVAVPTVNICQPNDATYTVDIGSIGGYNDPVTLSVSGVPAGATSSFSTNPVTPVGNSTLTITNTGSAVPGSYTLTISGVSTTGTKTTDVYLNISTGSPSAVAQTTPANLATGVNVPTNFTWTTAPEVGVTYEIDIATDAAFTAIVDQATSLATAAYTSTILGAGTTYYWRVKSITGCGSSAWSGTFSFTTSTCNTIASTDVGQTTDVASFTSIINVTATGNVSDINVASLQISHPWVGDLGATLTSPTGTVVQLFDGPGLPASLYGCDGDDIDVSFDDGAAQTSTDLENMCGGTAPSITGAFQSMDPLSNFNGESITGNWTLTVFDSYTAGDQGTLDAWSLELCTSPAVPCNDPDVPTISGITTICDGQSTTLTIATGNLNDATDWQWYAASCGGTVEGAGASITLNPSSTTSYFIRGEGGCVTPGTCVQIDVTVNPIYNLAESATICTGQTHTFPDLSTGTTSQVYTSTLTTAAGCDSIIVTTLDVVSSFTTNESATICEGDTHTFPDGTTGTTSQVYTSTLFSIGGCDSLIVTTLTVNTVDVSVTDNAPTLTANATGATYVWLDCDNGNAAIAGETSVSFTPTALVGNYAVEVTQNGCTDTSACYLVDQTGIGELGAGNVLVYPNPTSSEVTVSWTGSINEIEITDTQGKLLRRIDTFNGQEAQIELAKFSNGVYFIHILSDEGRTVFNLIKQ